MEDIIEQVKGADLGALEIKIEEEGNRLQRINIQRFLVDINLFISAIKKWAKSTDLLIYLLTDPEIELIVGLHPPKSGQTVKKHS